MILNPEAPHFALDRAAPDHPVRLHAFYGHGSVINSQAMPLLHITEAGSDPAGARDGRVAGSKRGDGRLW